MLINHMVENDDVAKNRINNCAEGRICYSNLWKKITNDLNCAGPPIKDEKSWRKVNIFS